PDADGPTPDERRAADSIAAGLAADPSFTGVDARCIARELVMDKGVVELQEQGVLDEDLQFIGDTNPAVNAELFTDLITISIGCAFETLDLDITPPSQ
ncbi:hypothetical protein, partial [Nocardioides stalactiti]|uniref:hypothetical protein n=1 Tax=Nocardioides stalactiti TaxID=2755356 RepID=UPI001600D9BD